jgi:pimeloyl-ACP methyl ester carboxylesterase
MKHHRKTKSWVSLSALCAFMVPALLGPNLRAAGVPHHVAAIQVNPSVNATLLLEGSVSNLFPVLPASVRTQYYQMYDLYLVDASPDLAQWSRQATLLRTNGSPSPLYWQDTNGATAMARFYRTPTNYLLTQFPIISGTYAVGKITRVLTDSSRTNRYGIPTNSSFMCTIWYPADTPAAGTLPALYADAAVVADSINGNGFGWPVQWVTVMTNCVAQAYTNVPMTSGSNRFPVIIYSHGLRTDRTINSQITIDLASHGYIVASVDHIDCHCTVFPDARGVVFPPGVNEDIALLRSRTNDLAWLLVSLAEFDSSDAVLAGRLDLNNVGAMGWSWGGATAGEFARVDSRIKCAALLDPGISPGVAVPLFSTGLQKPLLTMSDTLPNPSFLPTTSQFTAWSSNLFYMAITNAAWFQVSNANHPDFSDWGWAMNAGAGTRGAALAIDAGTLWLFDTYLKGEGPPFPTNSEIINVHRK